MYHKTALQWQDSCRMKSSYKASSLLQSALSRIRNSSVVDQIVHAADTRDF